jgi:hypothetical protein
MVGVMMSYKTLHGLDTKWTAAFPKNEEVADIFIPHPLAFNTLHYADYTNTDVTGSLAKAIRIGGKNMQALQLDMVWPHPDQVANALYLPEANNISVILQVGKNAIERAGNDPVQVVNQLGSYGHFIDGVLLDKSMGQGRIMDADGLLGYIEEIASRLPYLRIAVAGGLGPVTMDAVEPIVSRYPDISIDAQGRLRPSGSALDPIDWSLASRYLEEAVKLFAKYSVK